MDATPDQPEAEASTAAGSIRIFSSKRRKNPASKTLTLDPNSNPRTTETDHGDSDPNSALSFSDLGLSEWAVSTCRALGIRRPTAVQRRCVPHILAGKDVLAIARTGSGKTAAFALPILHRLSEDPYGVFALVVTPSRELAVQLIEQFRAFGASLNVRCCLVIGEKGIVAQAKALMERPHVVVATPGRIRFLMEQDPDIAAVFQRTKFLVLDEADRMLDVGFEEELSIIFKCLPKKRQTLLFSATKTSTLQALHEMSQNSTYFYEEYEGLRTVESLKQQYIFISHYMKEVYLYYILSKMKENGVRSAIVFVARCKSCHLLSLLLEQLGLRVVALHSDNNQSERLSALSRFKSGQVPVLLATDLASRGLDIPTVDLVINYDIPRAPPDYVHRVGRTARAGRMGLCISFVTQNDIELIHAIEAEIEKKLEEYEYNENKVLEDITKVLKARRIARMKASDDGYDEKVEARRKFKKRRRQDAEETET